MSRGGRRLKWGSEPTTTSNLDGIWGLNEINNHLLLGQWPTVPGIPTDLSYTIGNTQVGLSWTAPDNNGSNITDYIIEYSSDNGNTWTIFSDGSNTNTSSTVTSLTNDTQYLFRVAAVNSLGIGQYSSTVSATPEAPFVPVELNSSSAPGIGIPGAGYVYNNSGNFNSGYAISYAKPLRIVKYRINDQWWFYGCGSGRHVGITRCKLQGSNDNVSWVDLHEVNRPKGYTSENVSTYCDKCGCRGASSYSEFTFTNNNYYQYHRILVIEGETESCGKGGCTQAARWSSIQVYGMVGVGGSSDNLLQTSGPLFSPVFSSPNLTTLPTGRTAFIRISSQTDAAIKLFNGSTGGNDQSFKFYSSSSPSINIIFPYAVTVSAYKLWGGIEGDYYQSYANFQPLRNWQVYGSNNNSTWTLLDTQTDQSLPEIVGRTTWTDKGGVNVTYTTQNRSLSSANTYNINNPAAYIYYRIAATGPYYYAQNCNKSGCNYRYGNLSEIQLIGSY